MKRKVLVALAISLLAASWAFGGGSTAGAATATKDPVVIVGGTFVGDPIDDLVYGPLARRLGNDGYDVTIFPLLAFGTADLRNSARALDAHVDGVKASTGAAKVDVIGHSQGTIVSRWYLKNLGGAAEVDSLVSVGPAHYGTNVANAVKLLALGNCLGVLACEQMTAGSAFINELNAGPDTVGAVHYTNIVTALDVLVVPYTNGYFRDGSNYANVLFQSQCPLRVVGHATLVTDGAVYSGIEDALAKRAITFNCLAV